MFDSLLVGILELVSSSWIIDPDLDRGLEGSVSKYDFVFVGWKDSVCPLTVPACSSGGAEAVLDGT